MPLITRTVFFFVIGLHIMADPVSLLLKLLKNNVNQSCQLTMRRKLNGLLARKDILLIDGHEDEVFEYLTIPLTAFLDQAQPQLKSPLRGNF